jgi:predicted esterase
MALKVGLEYDRPLAAIMVFSGFYPPFTKMKIFNEKTPVFIAHGAKDKYLPWEKAL